jgi:hypothetical protein
MIVVAHRPFGRQLTLSMDHKRLNAVRIFGYLVYTLAVWVVNFHLRDEDGFYTKRRFPTLFIVAVLAGSMRKRVRRETDRPIA